MRLLAIALAVLAVSCREHPTAVKAPPSAVTIVAGNQQTAPPGTVLSIEPTVLVTDATGAPCSGITVKFTVTAGGGSVAIPNAITDESGIARAGQWTLGAAKGYNTLRASVSSSVPEVTFTAIAGLHSADVTVYFKQPYPVDFVGDSVALQAVANSQYSLANVAVNVAGRHFPLTYVGSSIWAGVVSLVGLPRDTVVLDLTATDVRGVGSDAFLALVHDRRPSLTVAAPVDYSVAQTSIDISAQCADDDPAGCTKLQVFLPGPGGSGSVMLASGVSSVSGTISLTPWNGQQVLLSFDATDSRGQVTEVLRTILVDGSSHLKELISGIGFALDYSAGRLLSSQYSSRPAPAFIETNGGATVQLPIDTGFRLTNGWLSPAGAIFVTAPISFPTTFHPRLYEWRDASLSASLGDVRSTTTLAASGNFASYVLLTPDLHRRDLLSGNDIIVANGVDDQSASVAANGDVAFTMGNSVYWYHNGSSILVSDSGHGAVTDGSSVVFVRSDGSLVQSDGMSQVQIASQISNSYYLNSYILNAGWIAFSKPDAFGAGQIWVRSPDGTLKQITQFGFTSQLEALGDDGSVVLSNGANHYYAAVGGPLIEIGKLFGYDRVLWRDGGFVMLRGRSALRISP